MKPEPVNLEVTVATTTERERRDRSALARMAGNIASGMLATAGRRPTPLEIEQIAEDAVAIARAIVRKIDGG